VKVRKLPKLAGLSLAALALTGCTVPTDPFVDVVKTTAVEAGFTDSGQMASGCVGMYLICATPMYEPFFYMPESAGAEKACDAALEIANKLGVVAYSGIGFSPVRIEPGSELPRDLCVSGLGVPLKNADGSDLYQGLAFYDDGSKDSFGKVYAFDRSDSEFGKVFRLLISFSKDQARVGPIIYANEIPKLMTQADLDAANSANAVAEETMKVANTLLGKAEKEAIAIIESNGFTWVVVDRDGKEFPTDKMYDPRRVRLTIREGQIYEAIAG
jgi:hypothetical protein